MLEPTPLDEA
ncbi:hypothetical protein E2320_016290, partial [Naja naja]